MSVDKSFSQSSNPVTALAFAAQDADANGATISMAGYHAITFLVWVGAWTDGTHTIGLERSDDGGNTWTDVPAEKIVGTTPVISDDSNDGAVLAFDYKGIAKHLRVTVTVAGATTGATLGVIALQRHPSYHAEHPLAN